MWGTDTGGRTSPFSPREGSGECGPAVPARTCGGEGQAHPQAGLAGLRGQAQAGPAQRQGGRLQRGGPRPGRAAAAGTAQRAVGWRGGGRAERGGRAPGAPLTAGTGSPRNRESSEGGGGESPREGGDLGTGSLRWGELCTPGAPASGSPRKRGALGRGRPGQGGALHIGSPGNWESSEGGKPGDQEPRAEGSPGAPLALQDPVAAGRGEPRHPAAPRRTREPRAGGAPGSQPCPYPGPTATHRWPGTPASKQTGVSAAPPAFPLPPRPVPTAPLPDAHEVGGDPEAGDGCPGPGKQQQQQRGGSSEQHRAPHGRAATAPRPAPGRPRRIPPPARAAPPPPPPLPPRPGGASCGADTRGTVEGVLFP